MVKSSQGLSVGSMHALFRIPQNLGMVKALGNTERARLLLWMVIARLIERGSRFPTAPSVTLPKVIPNSGMYVSRRKRLELKRKKQENPQCL